MTPECCSTRSSPSLTTQRDTPPTTMLAHLIFTVLLEQLGKGPYSEPAQDSSFRYLAFLQHAFNPEKGRFRNFLGYDRRWNEAAGSEDCHGRALWGLGTVLGRSKDQGLRCAAGRLFEISLPAVMEFSSPRAWAYALLGIQEYLDSYPGDRDAQKIRSVLSTRLLEMYESIRTSDWKWFENILAYGNARLPQACCWWALLARMIGWFPPVSKHWTGC